MRCKSLSCLHLICQAPAHYLNLSSPKKTSILPRHGSTTTSAKHGKLTSCRQRNDRSRKRPLHRTSRRTTLISRRSLLSHRYMLTTVPPRCRGDTHCGSVYDGDACNGDTYVVKATMPMPTIATPTVVMPTMVKERGLLARQMEHRRRWGRERREVRAKKLKDAIDKFVNLV